MSDAFDNPHKLRQEIGELWPRLKLAEARLAEANAAFEAEQTEKWKMAGRLAEAEALWHADGMIGEPLGREAHQALGDLKAALSDREDGSHG